MAQSVTTSTERGGLWRRLTGLDYMPDEAPARRASLLSASTNMSRRKIGRNHTTTESWQQEAIEMYSEVGELRYVANAQANIASRAKMFVGLWEHGNDAPTPVTDGVAYEVFEAFGGGVLARADMVKRLFIQLFVPGDAYVVGVPYGTLTGEEEMPAPNTLRLSDLEWHVLSATEVRLSQDKVTIQLGDVPVMYDNGQSVVVRVWRPNPFRWWQPDSPVRSNLPVLRELVGLTKHVSAAIDSRLAGAGVLLIGDSFSLLAGQSPEPDDVPESDPILSALMDAMLTSIKDRDSASAVMPILLQGPDEAIDKVKHLTFSTPFDAQTKDLRDEAIRRLSLGLDAPPEVLLGLATSNHWNAWIIQDDAIKTHINPNLALICDALTQDFLWPVLEEAGVSNWRDYAIWWDVSSISMKTDRSKEAVELFDRGVLTAEALRRETGFDHEDAPSVTDEAVELALSMVKTSPSLLAQMTLPQLVGQVRAALRGEEAEMPVAPPVVETEEVPQVDVVDRPVNAEDIRQVPDDPSPIASSL